MNYPRKPCKDGWMGPVPPEARDSDATLLHNIRWWFYTCKQGGMPPFKYDGAIDQWRRTVMALSGDRGAHHPKGKGRRRDATESVHSFSWHASEARCTARDIQSPLLHQALNPNLGIQRV